MKLEGKQQLIRNKRTLRSSSISSLDTCMAFPGGLPQKQNYTNRAEQAVIESL